MTSENHETRLIGISPTFRQLLERATAVAEADATVLLLGESGVGKELIARFIHEHSQRKSKEIITINCAAIPIELFESEFFGHVKGAFTGATNARAGRIAAAEGGTLFLDEIGEIPLALQGKLLRALQEKTYERVGETKSRRANVRIIAATNRDLGDEVKAGNFREDLFYRLNVIPLNVIPLRERREDIAPIAEYFLLKQKKLMNKPHFEWTIEQLSMLEEYSWPGNIRELQNVVERAVIMSNDTLRLDAALPPGALDEIGGEDQLSAVSEQREYLTVSELKEFERTNIILALERSRWRASGKSGAAAKLEMPVTTLNSKMKAMEITRPTEESLYFRLGGYDAVSRFIDHLIPNARCDIRLGRFWKNRGADSIRKEKRLTTEFLAKEFGGPFRYTGRDMKKTHAEMRIDETDWLRFEEILLGTLKQLGIRSRESSEIYELVKKLKPKIVKKKK